MSCNVNITVVLSVIQYILIDAFLYMRKIIFYHIKKSDLKED